MRAALESRSAAIWALDWWASAFAELADNRDWAVDSQRGLQP